MSRLRQWQQQEPVRIRPLHKAILTLIQLWKRPSHLPIGCGQPAAEPVQMTTRRSPELLKQSEGSAGLIYDLALLRTQIPEFKSMLVA